VSETKTKRRNGCTLALDWLPGIGDMGPCCEEHDLAYAEGIDRLEADQRFRDCIRMMGNKSSWWRKALVYAIAEARYRTVRAFGWIFYRSAQDK